MTSSAAAKALPTQPQSQEELNAAFRWYVEHTNDRMPIDFEQIIRNFLQAGADPDQYVTTDRYSEPIFMKLARFGAKTTLLHDMLAAGADPTLYDDRGATFLHRLANAVDIGGWLAELPNLLPHFKTPDLPSRWPKRLSPEDMRRPRDGETGLTPLHAATQSLYISYAHQLLEHGANPNYRTSRGNTPLHIAAYRRASQQTAQLLYYGADPDLTNYAGQTVEDRLLQDVKGAEELVERFDYTACLDALADARRYPWLRKGGEISHSKLMAKDKDGHMPLTSKIFSVNFVDIMWQLDAQGERLSGRDLVAYEVRPGSSVWGVIVQHSHVPQAQLFEALHRPGRVLKPEDITHADGSMNGIYMFLKNRGYLGKLFSLESWKHENVSDLVALFKVIPKQDHQLIPHVHALQLYLSRWQSQERGGAGRL